MTARPPGLAELALAAIAASLPEGARAGLPEPAADLAGALRGARAGPAPQDQPLVNLANALRFSLPELLTLALLVAVETEPRICRLIAAAQAPVGGARPLVGLLATAFAGLSQSRPLTLTLASSAAVEAGAFRLGQEDAPLPERSLSLATPLLHALLGDKRPPAGISLIAAHDASVLHENLEAAIAALQGDLARGLVIRAASEREGRAIVSAFAKQLGLDAVAIIGETLVGLAPWLIATNAMPVFIASLKPGERRTLPSLAPYAGPWLCISGRDGAVEGPRGPLTAFTPPPPDTAEREILWRAGGLMGDTAAQAARGFRQHPAQIADIAASAREKASRAKPGWPELEAALHSQPLPELEAHAERLIGGVDDDAFVAPPALMRGLRHLLDHCRCRDGLADTLGPAARNRYRPGVRALFHGAPGTGKSLAAHWLASRLAMPLFRVDLATLMSKWIGETEKNLSQLLAAAEAANVVLLFDEADALFSPRTDIGNANDRFANGQTVYLLQRLETYEGIVILTSNARDKIDSAFTRRFDAILEFPMPDGPARHALWRAHLGAGAVLEAADLNRLAAAIDLSGGHIRNMVIGAAVSAAAGAEPIGWVHVRAAAEAEFRKLGRDLPRELR